MELVRAAARWLPPALALKLVVWANIIVLALTVAAERILQLKIGAGFGEKGPATWFSFLQLLAIAALALMVVYVRADELRRDTWRSPVVLWLAVGLGFIAFAIDETLQIHEEIDFFIHRVLAIEETVWTDRIDDAVVGVYVLIGLAFGYFYRREVMDDPLAWKLFRTGLWFAVATIALDLLTNGHHLPITLNRWLGGFVEEAFKLLAEAMFIGVVYVVLRRALEARS